MTAAANPDTRFRLTEPQARHLASTFGTPLYVVDETHFRERIRAYRRAFDAAWPGGEISFASKANSACALLAIACQEGCHIDVASEGELRAALNAGVPASACHFHGNNKSATELDLALEQGIGTVIIDHLDEIDLIASFHPPASTKFLLRLAPGVDPITHAKISTGQADTKFGFNIGDGAAETALLRALHHRLNLVGFHAHVGSQLLDPEAQRAGGENLAQFAVEMRTRHGFQTQLINIGGGLGVRYTSADVPMSVSDYNRLVCDAVRKSLAGSGLHPTLAQEPGRSLIAESGVTLYAVGVVKTVPARTFVSVDGGLSDNPRPAMYGSRYTIESFRRGSPMVVTISGRHCETDELFPNVEVPNTLQAGDLIQVLATGAYNASMASNYNRFLRPAMVLIRANGDATLIQRRETYDELLAREIVPEDLC